MKSVETLRAQVLVDIHGQNASHSTISSRVDDQRGGLQAGSAYTDMTEYNPEPAANNTAVSIEGPSTSENIKSKVSHGTDVVLQERYYVFLRLNASCFVLFVFLKNAPKKRKLDVYDEGPTSKVAKTSAIRTEEAEAENSAESTGPVKPTDQAKSSRPLDISHRRHEDTCFVANFPADMTAAKLKELFQGEYYGGKKCTLEISIADFFSDLLLGAL
ncbi:hypothetical protein BGX34_005229 [Mortierella sp. NVP85]|nr:hypothetical protein BGX34_005229 [Mortierella sp. NVP85]